MNPEHFLQNSPLDHFPRPSPDRTRPVLSWPRREFRRTAEVKFRLLIPDHRSAETVSGLDESAASVIPFPPSSVICSQVAYPWIGFGPDARGPSSFSLASSEFYVVDTPTLGYVGPKQDRVLPPPL